MKLGILGCGNWGSVFGIIQQKNDHEVKIWEFDRQRALAVEKTRSNEPFLSGHTIPQEIRIEWEMEKVVSDADLVVFAVPCQTLKSVVDRLANLMCVDKNCLSLIKGIDVETLLLPTQVIAKKLKAEKIFALSGPSIANEIIREEPTAVVLAGRDVSTAKELQQNLSTSFFRVYLGTDMIGIELGGAVKNVLAIACGIIDGMGFGTNAKGALIARGIVEIQRLAARMGTDPRTLLGLSGLGDLVTTSFSAESRNHRFGVLIAQGETVKTATEKMIMVAEGAATAMAVRKLSHELGVEMPICDVMYEILYEHKPPADGIRDLMQRPLKSEIL
jgi:glycerol-3-phosphate dehydrogenase (NAD(P)+)